MNDFFNRYADFFAALTNEQKIFLGILSLILLFFGIIVGWIVQGAKTRRYKKGMLVLRKDRDLFEQQYRTADEQRKKTARELEAVSREKVDALDQVQELRNDLRARDNELVARQSRVEQLEAVNRSYVDKAAALEEKTSALERHNEALRAEAEKGAAAGAKPVEGAGNGHPPAPSAAPKGSTSPDAALAAYIAASEQRFEHLEDRLLGLAEANATLRAGGSAAPPGRPGLTPHHQPLLPPPVDTDADGEPLVIRADTTEAGIRTGGRGEAEVIVRTTPSLQVPPLTGNNAPGTGYDDLTRIDNIGPFLQAKLYEHDVTRYEQIAGWSEADVMTYTELIGYLPGIIQRDDWVGQAEALLAGAVKDPQPYIGSPDPVAYTGEAAGPATTAEDNLRLIEGIGPRIESILRASGIATFDQLADADVDDLRKILDEAGSHLRSHNPNSWPAQAGLAADGKLDELKAWQKELNA